MKEILENFNTFLIQEKGINVSPHLAEYLSKMQKTTITKQEVFNYISMLCIIKPEQLLIPPKSVKDRGGSNDIATARGLLIKYVIEHDIQGFNKSNVYEELFGFSMDRTSTYHWLNGLMKEKSERIYDILCTYLKNKDVLWHG